MRMQATITTTLEQTDGNGREEITASFSGTCLPGDGRVMLCYEEPDNGGPTRIVASGDEASLQRSGHVRSRMAFRPGRDEAAAYTTPLGALRMSVLTHEYRLRLSPEGGAMEVAYTLRIGGADIARNRLRVAWTVL